jgi:excisionase family DNA binding protein
MTELLCIKEACQRLRLSERTVYQLARDGKIPARKIGGGWRIPINELMAGKNKQKPANKP